MKHVLAMAVFLATACSTAPSPARPAQDIAASIPQEWPYPLQTEPSQAPRAMVATDAPLATERVPNLLPHGQNASAIFGLPATAGLLAKYRPHVPLLAFTSYVWLLANAPISPADVQALGYGESQPVANNETEEGRRRNRRIDVIIYPRW